MDPRIRAGFLIAAVISLIALLFNAQLGLGLGVTSVGVIALGCGHRDGSPLFHHVLVPMRYLTHRVRHDGASGSFEIQPWPHVAKLPAALRGTELLDADYPGRGRCGVVWHRPTGLTSATVLLEPSALLLSDPAVGETYAACWWSLLEDACTRADVTASAVTIDVRPGGGAQGAVRFTVTVDPCQRARVRSVAEAAAMTVGALASIDAYSAGVVVLRPATATDLARIARAAFEPRARFIWPGEEPPAWGELAPASEANGAKGYQHEDYTSVSYAMHASSARRFGADAVPLLLTPGTFARRVTLVRRESSGGSAWVFVTVSASHADDIHAARAEIESLVRFSHPRLELCRDLQAEAFGVGLPAGWFAPSSVEHILGRA